ncbi:MAG: hypothetical protein RL205_1724 [Actinomycetota bacterium]
MREIFTADQVRAAEAELMRGLPEGALMQRASFGLSVICARLLTELAGRVAGAQVLLRIGGGNNGGDALFAGAYLRDRGAAVTALLLTDTPHAGGLAALRRARGRTMTWSDDCLADVGDADLVIDGLVGIGGSGALREPMAECVRVVNALANAIVSVDIPSGVTADTGAVEGEAVDADLTVTFGGLKPGLLLMPGKEFAGAVHFVDIDLDTTLGEPVARLLEEEDVAGLLHVPSAHDHKYSRGVVEIIAGSAQYPGAALLAVDGARSAGAGMVRFLERPGIDTTALITAFPDVVISSAPDARIRARVIGPGFDGSDEQRGLLVSACAGEAPLVIDAGALTLLAGDIELRDLVIARGDAGAVTVLTPHDGEFSRFLPLGSDRRAAALALASELRAVVVLKGAGTVIADHSGDVFIDAEGTSDLATAGSGDVLAGLMGGLLATGAAGESAATALVAAAVFIHGRAGRIAGEALSSVTAADIADCVEPALAEVM